MFKKVLMGASASPLVLAGLVSAQTTTTTTPGVPNTGAGDVLVNGLILMLAGLIAFAGALYLYMQRTAD